MRVFFLSKFGSNFYKNVNYTTEQEKVKLENEFNRELFLKILKMKSHGRSNFFLNEKDTYFTLLVRLKTSCSNHPLYNENLIFNNIQSSLLISRGLCFFVNYFQ